MTEVSGWVFTICSGALVCGIVSALIPGKTYQGAIQLLLGLFMLFCFLSPVSLSWSWPEIELEEAEERRLEVAENTRQQLSAQLEHDSKQQLTEAAVRLLEPLGVEEREVDISLQREGDRLYAAIILPLRLRERHSSLVRSLEQAVGLSVEISYRDAP